MPVCGVPPEEYSADRDKAQTMAAIRRDGVDKIVFLSYSSKDKDAADKLCAMLEQRGVPCWIAPRDVRPGNPYPEEIVDAIDRCHGMVLILSENANSSNHVHSEIERAFSKGKAVFPVRIRNVQPCKALELFVSAAHWTDVWAGPAGGHVDRLARSIRRRVGGASDEAGSGATGAEAERADLQPGSVRETYRRMVERAWADGVFSNDEHEFLLLRARELGIPAEDAEDMIVTLGIVHARDDEAARARAAGSIHSISVTNRHRAMSMRAGLKCLAGALIFGVLGIYVSRRIELGWLTLVVIGGPTLYFLYVAVSLISGQSMYVECPDCGRKSTLDTKKSTLRCRHCGVSDVQV